MENSSDQLVLDVETPLGFRVRVTHAYWEFLVSFKHPAMAGRHATWSEPWRLPTKFAAAARMAACYYSTRRSECGAGFAPCAAGLTAMGS